MFSSISKHMEERRKRRSSLTTDQQNKLAAKSASRPATRADPAQGVLPPTSANIATPLPPTSNVYSGMLGKSTNTVAAPTSRGQKVKDGVETAFGGLKRAAGVLKEYADFFPPLKTAASVFLSVCDIIEGVSANKDNLEALVMKVYAILAIIQRYQDMGGLEALKSRTEIFSIALQREVKELQALKERSWINRAYNASSDSGALEAALRNIGFACEIFQMDIQLQTGATVENVLQILNSRSIDRLHFPNVSYQSRHSSYGDPRGCMDGTRVNVLKKLEQWFAEEHATKVYWLSGMAGTGKSTISQTFCEILDGKQMLGASFFCSRTSGVTSDARHIIPSIAYSLAHSSPAIKLEIIKAVDETPDLAESNDLQQQFQKLISNPVRNSFDKSISAYKVVVIDAVDECTDLRFVRRLITLLLEASHQLPLKIFVSSRDEYPIRRAFDSLQNSATALYLHGLEKDVVSADIRLYLSKTLRDIQDEWGSGGAGGWPPAAEVDQLVSDSGSLFVYAATASRYIQSGRRNYKNRLTTIAGKKIKSEKLTSSLDELYAGILQQALAPMEQAEVEVLRDLVSNVVFLRRPLTTFSISSLSGIQESRNYLSTLTSVICVPTDENFPVAIFHASFPEFLTDPERCSISRLPNFKALDASDGHFTLALLCLERLNVSLKYNICNTPKEFTLSRRERTNSPDDVNKISEELRYSCTYWASHLAEVKAENLTRGNSLASPLREFLEKHLLHWIECLSLLGELKAGVKALQNLRHSVSQFDIPNATLVLVYDGLRMLQMSYEAIQKNRFEVYQSALVWIPMKCRLREAYARNFSCAPKVLFGLPHAWDPTELVIRNGSEVNSVANSPDGVRIISGSANGLIKVWNALTGEMELELKGHGSGVTSVAFSCDGSRAVSGSDDCTIKVWNAITGEMESEFSHKNQVASVAISREGQRVLSRSSDGSVKVWNATTGKVETELKEVATTVGFSPDGSRIAFGSKDRTIKVWNLANGTTEAVMKGHSEQVKSVAFSPDGARVASGSSDKTVRVWNVKTGKTEAEMTGHTAIITSVAFAPDGIRVVSGSWDNTIKVWNTSTKKVEAELKGHSEMVSSVFFSPDGNRVISGSSDTTIRVWVINDYKETECSWHQNIVLFVAFSSDGSRVVSGSWDETVKVCNAATGKIEAELEGELATTIAFSPDSSRVALGSHDYSVRVWNILTGDVEKNLKGHTEEVTSVAFSPDGARLVSGSGDCTVKVWDIKSGKEEKELKGKTASQSLPQPVTSVAFSPDGTRVLSRFLDNKAMVWNLATGGVLSETALLPGFSGAPDPNETVQDVFFPKHKSSSWLHSDSRWIINRSCDCYVPPVYQNIHSTSFHGDRVCLGLETGPVIVLDMSIT